MSANTTAPNGPANMRTSSSSSSTSTTGSSGSQFNPAPPAAPFTKSERPASEIFFANAPHALPEAESVDKWFESLSQFEDMLEDMAKVSLDPVFKDELNAIDQWFSVLSEPERTAALYSLMQHCSDLQVRFFITILQQMLKLDPNYQPPIEGDDSIDQKERHSIAVQGSYNKLATGQGGVRMSYDGPMGSYPSGPHGQQSALSQKGAGWATGGGNASSDNILLSAGDVHAAAAAKWGLGGAAGASGSALNSPMTADMARRSGLGTTGERPKSSNEADMNPDWRTNRQSSGSSLGVDMQQLAVPGSQRQSNNVFVQQGTPRGSMIDMEPKDFRWSSLTDSLEPYGNLGPDPNASALAQMLDTKVDLGTSRGSIAARRSISNRLSIAVKSPRDTMQMGASMGSALASAQQQHQYIQQPSAMRTPGGNSYGAMHYQARTQQHAAPHTPYSAARIGANNSGSAASSPSRGNFARHGNPPQSPAGPKPQDVVDFELIKDIPAWLRSLRLHKYTECFNGLEWTDIVQMNDEQLQARGVSALGARRKMLKVFELVQAELGGKKDGE
ncbi:Flap-structured DNA-binding and RNA-binding protein [Linderina macrospora]|uniref:Flap-structured DNA-binding and RNA-binding protein n=1 Tax=Linderina macrospora TaxID=4868 RepID=A0ACC1JG82_9FUNG|nr:Flap-structured DNA-binding and RNA-binding protein [Linderina macrospora]